MLRRHPHRLERRLTARDGTVVLTCTAPPAPAGIATVVRIEGTALAVWELLDDAPTIAALVDTVAARFGVPAATVTADVAPLLAGWREAGVVVDAHEPSR